jgi:aminoglycoside phosphotransferase (APT) family kinase protein
VTVPAVHLAGDEADGLGGAFFVMDLVRGEALARRLLRDERYAATRAALPAELGRELARTHEIDLADASLSFLTGRAPAGDDPRRFALAEVDRYRTILDAFAADQPYPLLRLVARWLAAHAPAVSRPALVHGDFRIGNVMFDEKGLTAVLDWELCHVGDPVEDLGWLCVKTWRFGNDALAAGGLCSREELVRHYAAAGGGDVSMEALRWWELFGNWKWAVICRMQAERHKAAKHPDVELATIGRRVAETEHEILSLLGTGTLRN